MLLNEYKKETGFYKLWGIEGDVRTIAKNNPNSYQICLFACCREVLMPAVHGGGFRSRHECAMDKMNKLVVKGILARLKNSREAYEVEAAIRKAEEKSKEIDALAAAMGGGKSNLILEKQTNDFEFFL